MTVGRRKWRYYHCHLQKRHGDSQVLVLWLEPSILTQVQWALHHTTKVLSKFKGGREAKPTWRIWNGFMEDVAFEMRCWQVNGESGGKNSQQEQYRWKVCRAVRNLTGYGKDMVREGLGKQGRSSCEELLRAGLQGSGVQGSLSLEPCVPDTP